MKIGELATQTGASIRMLRYYEQEGLLRPARRSSGYRDFTEADVQTVQRIRMLGEAGLTLANIRQLLPCMQGEIPGLQPCEAVLATLHREIATLDGKIAYLQGSREILARYLAGLQDPSNPRS